MVNFYSIKIRVNDRDVFTAQNGLQSFLAVTESTHANTDICILVPVTSESIKLTLQLLFARCLLKCFHRTQLWVILRSHRLMIKIIRLYLRYFV